MHREENNNYVLSANKTGLKYRDHLSTIRCKILFWVTQQCCQAEVRYANLIGRLNYTQTRHVFPL